MAVESPPNPLSPPAAEPFDRRKHTISAVAAVIGTFVFVVVLALIVGGIAFVAGHNSAVSTQNQPFTSSPNPNANQSVGTTPVSQPQADPTPSQAAPLHSTCPVHLDQTGLSQVAIAQNLIEIVQAGYQLSNAACMSTAVNSLSDLEVGRNDASSGQLDPFSAGPVTVTAVTEQGCGNCVGGSQWDITYTVGGASHNFKMAMHYYGGQLPVFFSVPPTADIIDFP
ncbi:MAG TPA: hypothetical protein VLE72_02750 [Candidatus Saccharimonadales bacterium]|nr:hypothetical protein [Candidatus Saccharimonadales bacterium]